MAVALKSRWTAQRFQGNVRGVIQRVREIEALRGLLSRHRVVAILGPRQVGKTTLARQYAQSRKGPVTFYDLESPRDVARFADPMLALQRARGLVVLDEIQHVPEIFRVLRVLVDRPRSPARFLVLGSASPDLLRQSSETLAGRIAHLELAGLGLHDVGPGRLDRLWLRGGFPRSYLARSNGASLEWRREFVRTFLERDLPQLGISFPAPTMRRFWSMLAHYHGQIWSASEIARSFGVADTTVRRYLDALASTLVVHLLGPWHENVGKRQVKAPKIYFADSGLLHALLDLETMPQLDGHPKVGASWEGFALQLVLQQLGARHDEAYFWATHGGAELDLLIARKGRRLGFEFKRTVSPRISPSMRSAMADLKLARLDVVHSGPETFPLAEKIRAVALSRIHLDLKP